MEIEDRIKAVREIARRILRQNPSIDIVTLAGDGYEVQIYRVTDNTPTVTHHTKERTK